jgi:hypothetical protein
MSHGKDTKTQIGPSLRAVMTDMTKSPVPNPELMR